MLLKVSGLTKGFSTEEGVQPVLRGVDLSLVAGDRMALTGESGSGKSTLLYLIAGLEAADSGNIAIEGRAIAGLGDEARAAMRRNTVGVIFQQFNLIPSLNVLANLRFYARLAGREDAEWNQTLVKRLGLERHLKHYPEQLSGGQQQRLAIGRTLAARPRLVLADEPTGNLDEQTADSVIGLMLDLVAETNAGLLMVTHSSRLADRMDLRVHLAAGQVA